jgi:Transposase DDE domain
LYPRLALSGTGQRFQRPPFLGCQADNRWGIGFIPMTNHDSRFSDSGYYLKQWARWQEGRAAKGKPPADGIDRYRARKADCDACELRSRCRPGDAGRKVLRSIHEGARDLARDISLTDAYVTSRKERKKVEMLFAHLKRILKLDRLRLRGPNGAKDEFLLAATAQNLRKLAKLFPMTRRAMAG